MINNLGSRTTEGLTSSTVLMRHIVQFSFALCAKTEVSDCISDAVLCKEQLWLAQSIIVAMMHKVHEHQQLLKLLCGFLRQLKQALIALCTLHSDLHLAVLCDYVMQHCLAGVPMSGKRNANKN